MHNILWLDDFAQVNQDRPMNTENKSQKNKYTYDLKFFLNSFIHGDCINIMKQFPSNSVDMVFADPPYNLQINENLKRPNNTLVDGVNDNWDKFSSFQEYDDFSIAWLKESKRILKTNGSLWLIGSYHNIFRLGKIIQDLGFWILNDIVWIKSNPMPNFRGKRFTNAHETLIWCIPNKDQKTYTFNYQAMKALNEDLQMRSDWKLPICRGKERLTLNGKKAHTTQKPEALLSRLILASSNEGDLIVDPFSGTGTTAAAAKKLNRKFIGIEKNQNYINISNDRLKLINSYDSEALQTTKSLKTEPRVPFGWIVERGLINPGEIIFDYRRKYHAKVRVDGTLITTSLNTPIVGSIHKVGAEVQGAQACNGWTFWHFDAKDGPISINVLRQQLRAEMH